jgi:hypothetical protein
MRGENKMFTTEMRTTIEALYESVGYEPEACCQSCPYRETCIARELFYSCGVWEDAMGEDL